MWLSVLGPLAVRNGAAADRISAGKLRVLLAALSVRPNQVRSYDELAGTLWDGSPPAAVRPTLRGHVKRLRQVLGSPLGDRVLTCGSGYLIQLGDDELDLLRFEQLYRSGGAAIRARAWERASRDLTRALALWLGPALADVPSETLQREEVPRLNELRVQAAEWRIEADLQLGASSELVPELRGFLAEYPLRERFHGQLMLALYRGGRQVDALDHYQQVRRTLIDQVGVEPAAELQELQQRILAADTEISPPGRPIATVQVAPRPGRAGRPSPQQRVPHQLPASVPVLVGRDSELATLSGMLDDAGRPGGGALAAISGMAGVGKTALAVYWAHQVVERFPDGQLYVNLQSFSPATSEISSGRALHWMLEALGVPTRQIPRDLEARAALYRTVLDGRRVLVLLDNASSADHVRPLLPGTAGCLAMVTSRNTLVSLAATEGARLINMDLLTRDQSREVLVSRLEPRHIAAGEESLNELVELCARLPLALTVVAARAAAQPHVPLATVTAAIRDTGHRLDALDVGDAAASVRTVLSWSVRQLDDPCQRMFRLLGIHPAADITVGTAASLAASHPATAHRSLDRLAQANLLAEHAPGRYAFHDLVSAYATEQSCEPEQSTERRAAIGRMLGYYLHSASAADRLLHPGRRQITLIPLDPVVIAERPADLPGAMSWFDAEHDALLGSVKLAADNGFDTHAWQLPWALSNFLERRGHWRDWDCSQRTALAAARRTGKVTAEAHAHSALGKACARLGEYRDAHGHLAQAVELFQKTGDRIGVARSHQAISLMLDQQDCPDLALEHEKLALALYHQAGYRDGEASALNAIGWLCAQTGSSSEAIDHCGQALELLRELGNQRGEAAALDSLGYVHNQQRQFSEAVEYYRQSIRLFRDLGDRSSQAEILEHLGDAQLADGDEQAARDAWRQSLDILDQLHHPSGEEIRGKLSSLDSAV